MGNDGAGQEAGKARSAAGIRIRLTSEARFSELTAAIYLRV
jgi:hypothetical protein